MTLTLWTLLAGFGTMLVGIGLLGTLLGVVSSFASFSDIATGLIMASYYAGYIAGTFIAPRAIRNVGHIRVFAACAALGAASSLAFGLLVHPVAWLLLRFVSGLSVLGLYMVVESWLNAQCAGPERGRMFSIYMTSTLVALGLGQFLLLTGDPRTLTLFAAAAMLISLGVVPVAVTRVTEPRIEVHVPVGLAHLLAVSPLGTVGALGAGIINGGFWGMTAVFSKAIGLDKGQIAVLMSATILGGALLQWPLGKLSDRVDRRVVLVGVCFAAALASAAAGSAATAGTGMMAAAAFVNGGLIFAIYAISVAHTNDHLSSAQVLEATQAMLLVFGVGAVLGPIAGGVAMRLAGPVGLPMVASGTALVIAVFGLYRMVRRAPPPAATHSDFVPLVRTSPVALEMHPEAERQVAAEP